MEQLNALIEKAKTDNELKEKINALGSKGAGDDEIVALAAEYGFTITVEQMEEMRKQKELSEEQLEDVAGGGDPPGNNCWFTPTGNRKTVIIKGYEIPFMECNSTCWQVGTCWCYKRQYGDRGICVDKWHEVDDEFFTLYPVFLTNHQRKKPPTYNT